VKADAAAGYEAVEHDRFDASIILVCGTKPRGARFMWERAVLISWGAALRMGRRTTAPKIRRTM